MPQQDGAACDNVEAVFLEAVEMPTASQRSEFVDTACAEGTPLRERVEALLRAHDCAEGILDGPLVEFALRTGTSESLRDVAAQDLLAYLEPVDDGRCLGRLGPYEVEQVIGRGGMGIVLRARDSRLGRTVALKVLAPEVAASVKSRRRFVDEARAAASVRHDHVVTLHSVEEQNNLPYLVMDYLPDGSLDDWIRRHGPLAPEDVARVGRQIALGLAAVHERGLVFRDIKPANILLENALERVRITDFGIARAVDRLGLTTEGFAIGTPLYMSPEQAAAGLSAPADAETVGDGQRPALDQRSDLFSLGSLFYAMCTGRPPFSGETSLAVIREVCEATPPPLRERCPEAPAWLEAIVARLLEKDPQRRFQNAAEVAAALESRGTAACDAPTAAIARRPDSGSRAARTRAAVVRPGRRWIAVGLASLLGVAALTVLAGFVGASRGWFGVALSGRSPNASERGESTSQPTSLSGRSQTDSVTAATDIPPAAAPLGETTSKLYGEIGRMQFPGRIVSLDLSPDGKLAYVAVDKLVHVCDLAERREIGLLEGHEDTLAMVAVSPDGARIATGAFDRTLRIWDAEHRQLARFELPVSVRCGAFSPDHRQLLVSFAGATPHAPELGSLTIYDVETGDVVRKLTDDMEEAFWSAAWSPTGGHVAGGNYRDQVALFETQKFDTPTRGQERFVSPHGAVYALQFSSDGARLYSGGTRGIVYCWNLADGSRPERWDLGRPVKGFDLSSDESVLLLRGGTNAVRVFDSRRKGEQALTELPGHTAQLSALRFYGDDSHAVSASHDGTLRLWKLPPRP